jgi:hypothetical protein
MNRARPRTAGNLLSGMTRLCGTCQALRTEKARSWRGHLDSRRTRPALARLGTPWRRSLRRECCWNQLGSDFKGVLEIIGPYFTVILF